ncbi:DMT family transporter [Oceanimonas smirnovii]|uniref:DMT family transporter n=1 Tax=Oceanimonas smirnovii TaxID=264574 RepID=UPI003FD31888
MNRAQRWQQTALIVQDSIAYRQSINKTDRVKLWFCIDYGNNGVITMLRGAKKIMTMTGPWIFLMAAIAAEVVGVVTMKIVSDSTSVPALLFMYAMIGLSFYFLALAVKQIPLAKAYATWEAAGLISITFIGFQFFNESLSWTKLLGLTVLVTGVVLTTVGASTKNVAGD